MGLLVRRSGSPRRALIIVAVIWAIGFAMLAALMAHAIITQDLIALRMWFLWHLAWSPLLAVGGYFAVREAWSGTDHILAGGVASVAVIALVVLVSYFVYPKPIQPGWIKRMDGIDPKATDAAIQNEILKRKYGLE